MSDVLIVRIHDLQDSSGELDEGNVWPEATTDFKSDAWLEYERKLREQLDQPDADVDESPEGGADFDLGFDDLDEEESGGAARGGAATIVTGDGGRAELNQTETEDEDDEDSEDDEEEDLVQLSSVPFPPLLHHD